MLMSGVAGGLSLNGVAGGHSLIVDVWCSRRSFFDC